MISRKIAFGVCVSILLAVSACSRQQSEWQKTRETNTTDAYEQFLKKYPSGEFTAQAQARVKELYEERDWQKARDADTPDAYQAFLKQYPEGKWTEEARIRVENFTLAQPPSGNAAASTAGDAAPPGGADSANAAAAPPATPPTDADESPAPPAAAAMPPSHVPSARPAPAAHPGSAGHSVSATVAPAATAGGGSFGVQLGAFKSGADAAHARWAHLQKAYPTVLAGLSSKVVPKTTSSGKLYRLQAVGLTEKRARAICSSLKAKAQACVVVPPAQA